MAFRIQAKIRKPRFPTVNPATRRRRTTPRVCRVPCLMRQPARLNIPLRLILRPIKGGCRRDVNPKMLPTGCPERDCGPIRGRKRTTNGEFQGPALGDFMWHSPPSAVRGVPVPRSSRKIREHKDANGVPESSPTVAERSEATLGPRRQPSQPQTGLRNSRMCET